MPGFDASGSVKSLEMEVNNVTLAYYMIPELEKKRGKTLLSHSQESLLCEHCVTP